MGVIVTHVSKQRVQASAGRLARVVHHVASFPMPTSLPRLAGNRVGQASRAALAAVLLGEGRVKTGGVRSITARSVMFQNPQIAGPEEK